MGRLFLREFEEGRVIICTWCDTHMGLLDQFSTVHNDEPGSDVTAVSLRNKVINVQIHGPTHHKQIENFIVSDTYCIKCGRYVGRQNPRLQSNPSKICIKNLPMDTYFGEESIVLPACYHDDFHTIIPPPIIQLLPPPPSMSPESPNMVSEDIMKELDKVDEFFKFESPNIWQYPPSAEEEQQKMTLEEASDDCSETDQMPSPHQETLMKIREEFLKILGEIADCLESKITHLEHPEITNQWLPQPQES